MNLRHRIGRTALSAVASAAMLSGATLALVTASPAGAATNAIVLTINTLATGNNGTTVTLPLYGSALNATVSWGDGNSTVADQAGNLSYTYSVPGTYTITVTGDVPQFGTPSGTAPVPDLALTAVTNWDGVGLTSLYNAFSGDSNLVSVPTDLPLSVSDTGFMFSNATNFNQNLNTWDTTSVTDMSGMFNGDTAFNNAGLPLVEAPGVGWDTTNVTDMNYMFGSDTAFNQNLGSWNISQVSNLADALDATSLSTANFDATLTGWASQPVLPGLTLGAAGLTYDANAQAAYTTLTSTPDSWTIIDAGEVATVTPLTITTTSGTVGTPVTLATSGGPGTGAITYSVVDGTATGCVINGDTLSATSAGTCVLTATEASSGTTAAFSSVPTTIEFVAAATPAIPAPLTLGFAPKSTTLGSAEQNAISALSKKLEAGAKVTVTGYAEHNTTIARQRANAVATILRADGVSVNMIASGQIANKVVIATTAQ